MLDLLGKKRIGIIGLSAEKLWGENLSHPLYDNMYNLLENEVLSIAGGSPFVMLSELNLGVETLFAELALVLMSGGDLNLDLYCVLSKRYPLKKWTKEAKERFKIITARSQTIYYDKDLKDKFKGTKMLIGYCNHIILVWDGKDPEVSLKRDLIKKINKKVKISILAPTTNIQKRLF